MNSSPKKTHWAAKVLTWLLAAFLVFDGVMKLVQPAPVRAAALHLGFSPAGTTVLGLVVLVATVIFLVPRSSIIGAIVLTGYLGGAVACQILSGAAHSSVLFPLIFAALVWLSWLFRGATVCFQPE